MKQGFFLKNENYTISFVLPSFHNIYKTTFVSIKMSQPESGFLKAYKP